MCSDKQRIANQNNSKRSTGPKSVEGKTRVGQNATRHGLRAKSVIVLNEKAKEFDAFAEESRDELRPRGPIQRELVDRIVLILWKLRRVSAAEQTVYKNWSWKALNQVSNEEKGWEIPVQSQVGDVLANEMNEADSQLVRLQTYECKIERGLHAALREYRAMKKLGRELVEETDELNGGTNKAISDAVDESLPTHAEPDSGHPEKSSSDLKDPEGEQPLEQQDSSGRCASPQNDRSTNDPSTDAVSDVSERPDEPEQTKPFDPDDIDECEEIGDDMTT